jgi:hypothetical protein
MELAQDRVQRRTSVLIMWNLGILLPDSQSVSQSVRYNIGIQ